MSNEQKAVVGNTFPPPADFAAGAHCGSIRLHSEDVQMNREGIWHCFAAAAADANASAFPSNTDNPPAFDTGCAQAQQITARKIETRTANLIVTK